jgi:hypothetical protein
VEYESVQLVNNPAYGAANIYEEIKWSSATALV